MSCWELLGIDSISTKKEIKQAYAAKVKQLNIDKEPEAFQQLKEAFDQALALAEMSSDVSVSYEEKELEEISFSEEALLEEQSVGAPQDAVQIFAKQLSDLYNEKAFFDYLSGWQSLFANELEWSIAEYEHIEGIVQRFLLENYPILSKRVIQFLGECFDFSKIAEDVRRRTPFSAYWEEMQHVPDYSFEVYQQISEELRIPYFFARYELYQLLAEGVPERNTWRKKLVECQGILTEDIDLLNLQVAYTLVKDAKLTMEHSKWRISGLFGELQALEPNETTIFLSNYIDWVSGKETAGRVLIKEPDELPGLPYSVFLLLTGHAYAGLKEASEAKSRFSLLEQIAPSMIRREARAGTVNEVKPKQKSSKAIWGIVVVVLLFLRLISISDRMSTYKSSQVVLPETFFEDSSEEHSASSFSDLRKSTVMHNKFVYFFYIDREDEAGRQEFIDEHVTESEKARFLSIDFQQLSSLDLEGTDAYPVSGKENLVAEYGQVNGLKFGMMDYPFVILQLDDDGKIKDVFGKGWTELEKSEYTMLRKSLDVSPWTSRSFFFFSYLVTEHRELKMEYQLEFTTDSVKQLLREHADYMLDVETSYWEYQDSFDNQKKEYTIFDYKNGEVVLIISYDEYGRVDHVYGDGWETLAEDKRQQVLANAEA